MMLFVLVLIALNYCLEDIIIGSSVNSQGSILFQGFTFNIVFVALALQPN